MLGTARVRCLHRVRKDGNSVSAVRQGNRASTGPITLARGCSLGVHRAAEAKDVLPYDVLASVTPSSPSVPVATCPVGCAA